MQKTTYDAFKYSMQDSTKLYIGSKYTFAELLEDEDLNFRFRMIVNTYILPQADPEDTLESHLYFLEPDSFLVKIYDRMKARVKVNVIREKRHLFGGRRKEYVTESMTVSELSKLSVKQKEAVGLVVSELAVSKLALLSI